MAGLTVAYPLGDSLYLNITNRCTNDCLFCIRRTREGIGAYDLWLDREPDLTEVLAQAADAGKYREVVFCGYGEPLVRADLLLEAARELKKKGARVRINTNGHAGLIHGRNVAAEFGGLVDAVSVSLNASDAASYNKLCRPQYGIEAFKAVLEFARQCIRHVPQVTLTAVEWPGVDVEGCRGIARAMGAGFRVRRYSGPKA
ncbi:MAG: TatD family nuclease-associated radical SAM protein [Firmicutes bacterium]|nr:TatD family nuclease-associated radical SAM protein [Bacillota bacterium]